MSNEPGEIRNPIACILPETRDLADRLCACKAGEVVAYADMTRIIGENILNRRGILASALRIAQREGRKNFATIRKVGVKCLEAGEAVNLADCARDRIRRVARKAITALITPRFEDMTNEERTKNYGRQATLGVIEHVSRDRTAKKIESRVTEAKRAPIAETLAALAAPGE
jgi:hypothetical protein